MEREFAPFACAGQWSAAGSAGDGPRGRRFAGNAAEFALDAIDGGVALQEVVERRN